MKFPLMTMLTLLLIMGCSAPKLKVDSGSIDPSKPTILIAVLKGAASEAKHELINNIRADYADSFNVAVREVKGHGDLADGDYRALIVMEQLKAWTWFNGGLKDIAAKADRERTVYFISAGDSKWRWKRSDLKVVTAATQKVKAADSYQELKPLLEDILK